MMVILPEYINVSDLRRTFPAVFATASYIDVGVGWLRTVHQFVADAQRAWKDVAVNCITQKYGSMQIDCARPPVVARDDISLAIALAEARSMRRCECCGKLGYIRQPPPTSLRRETLACRCDVHATERQHGWPCPDFYISNEIHVLGRVYRYIAGDDCLEMADPPLGQSPAKLRYPYD